MVLDTLVRNKLIKIIVLYIIIIFSNNANAQALVKIIIDNSVYNNIDSLKIDKFYLVKKDTVVFSNINSISQLIIYNKKKHFTLDINYYWKLLPGNTLYFKLYKYKGKYYFTAFDYSFYTYISRRIRFENKRLHTTQ